MDGSPHSNSRTSGSKMSKEFDEKYPFKDSSEDPPPHHRRDFSFYIVLFLAVGPIWSIVPLSWAFVTYFLWTGRFLFLSWQGKVGFAWALCEVFFSVYYHQLARYISGPSPASSDFNELQAAFSRVLKAGLASLPEDGFEESTLVDERPGSPAETVTQLHFSDPRAIDFRNSLRTWFGKVPWSSIHTREVYAWLYWSIFNSALPSLDVLSPTHRAALDDALEKIQMRTGCIIPKGSNPALKPLLLTLDPVNVSFRPLVWYIIVAISNRILRYWFKHKWGARHGCYKGLEYLVRIPPNWRHSTGPQPLVFMHGLGLGLAQYKLFLSHLLHSLPDRPLLVPLQPHVSQDIFHHRFLRPMGRHETADALAGLLRKLKWVPDEDWGETETDEEISSLVGKRGAEGQEVGKGVTMLSHSNGSYAHAWILKTHPKMISRSCFVDPVTFCGWEGDVCYNFIYRPCSTGMELVVRYFVGTELGVANLLQRHFDWSSNSLWYEDIPNARDPSRTMFLLGGNDAIVNAERVKKYLLSHGIRKGLWFDPKGRHGQALLTGGQGHREILRWLRER